MSLKDLIHKLEADMEGMRQVGISKEYTLFSPEVQDKIVAHTSLTIGDMHLIIQALMLVDLQHEINNIKKNLKEA